jgi:hypothetical protein
MCLRRKLNFLFQIKYILIIYISLMTLVSTNCFAEKEQSVNVITWWGYLDSPEVAQEVKKQCHVNLSHDTYYTNNEFLRRVNTNKTRYDIIIFTQTIYDLVKNQIPKNKVNLAAISEKFNPIIKSHYKQSQFPPNVIYFMHSLSGFLWNPNVINLSSQDSVEDIFKKADKNIIVMIDDPLEVWNLINKAYRPKNIINLKNYNESVQINSDSFKKLIQIATAYTSNNYNQVYDQKNFAFAFGWSGDAIVYMKQAKKSFKFLIHPKLSYISSDLMAAMNDDPKTVCAANVLMSKKVLDIVENNTYYFSPYGDYQTVNDSFYKSIYQEVFKKLSTIQWLEAPPSSADFEKMTNDWNEVQLNMRNN